MVKTNELGFENTQSELSVGPSQKVISEAICGTFKIIEQQNSEP